MSAANHVRKLPRLPDRTPAQQLDLRGLLSLFHRSQTREKEGDEADYYDGSHGLTIGFPNNLCQKVYQELGNLSWYMGCRHWSYCIIRAVCDTGRAEWAPYPSPGGRKLLRGQDASIRQAVLSTLMRVFDVTHIDCTKLSARNLRLQSF